MSQDKGRLLAAMKAEAIPEGWSGLWEITKQRYENDVVSNRFGKEVLLPAGTYTWLRRWTASTLHDGGAVVMEDTPFELKTHLGFVLRAFGNVLVTGLGLGCVTRGLLANPRVSHVTVIENSPDVMKLVAPYMPSERLTIIEADALKWTAGNIERFDCAWHDLWTNHDEGEPHLDVWHVRMFKNLTGRVKHQGAWALRRDIKSQLIRHGFPWIG